MHFLSEVEKLLDMPPAEKSQVMRELTSHYYEIRDELIASGMGETEAISETSKRLGDPKDVAARLNPVHCTSTWKTAFITGIPFVLMAVFASAMSATHLINPVYRLLGISFEIGITALLVLMSLKELRKDMRPIWLATWLASAIYTLPATYGALTRIILPMGTSVKPLHICSLLIVSTIAGFLCRDGRKPLIAVGIISVVQLGLLSISLANTHSNGVVPRESIAAVSIISAVSIILGAVILTIIALHLFSSHKYGSPAGASLFLFSYFWITFWLGWKTAFYIKSSLVSPQLIAAGVMAIIVARAFSQRIKISVMVAGIAIEFFVVEQCSTLLSGTIISLFMLVLVLIPAFGLRKTASENRAELA